MSRASEKPRLWLPHHWPTWVALGVFRLLSELPWSMQRAFAWVLGTFAYFLVPIRRHVVLVNLRLCFPDKSESGIRVIARAHYQSLALGLFETCCGWWARTSRLPAHRIDGREHLANAVGGNAGVVLLTAHFTTLELCARMMNEQFRLGCLYRDPNNPVIAAQMRIQRERHVTIAIHFDDLKGLIRALRSGQAIWYAPDQGKRTKQTEILPFFGVPAITNTATGKLAAMTHSPVVPYFARRETDGSYSLTILPALNDFPTEDASADAVRVNRLIEEHIRLAPEQYLWVHKRFKARGPGYPEVY
ncbi:MAG: lipid A biosynthesis acyltransferase [Opitutus sp.]